MQLTNPKLTSSGSCSCGPPHPSPRSAAGFIATSAVLSHSPHKPSYLLPVSLLTPLPNVFRVPPGLLYKVFSLTLRHFQAPFWPHLSEKRRYLGLTGLPGAPARGTRRQQSVALPVGHCWGGTQNSFFPVTCLHLGRARPTHCHVPRAAPCGHLAPPRVFTALPQSCRPSLPGPPSPQPCLIALLSHQLICYSFPLLAASASLGLLARDPALARGSPTEHSPLSYQAAPAVLGPAFVPPVSSTEVSHCHLLQRDVKERKAHLLCAHGLTGHGAW